MIAKVEKIVYPGKGLARGSDGVATFVDGVLEGETAEVEVYKRKKDFREARVRKIIDLSPLRINAKCPSYYRCGGCSFQHTSYVNQLRIKESCVKEFFRRPDIRVNPIIGCSQEWQYRNKMEFSFFKDESGVNLGLHRKGEFDKYCGIPPCHIASGGMEEIAAGVLEFAKTSGLSVYDKVKKEGFYRHLVLRKGCNTGEIMVNLVTNNVSGCGTAPEASFFDGLVMKFKDKVKSFLWSRNSKVSDTVAADSITVLYGSGRINEKLDVNGRNYFFSISPFSFFQTNTSGAERLYNEVFAALKCSENDNVLDMYCGTGSIGITLAPFVKSVFGIEQVKDAVNDAEINKKLNGLENISFEYSTVESWVKSAQSKEFNAVILDPPRAGVAEKVIDYVGSMKPDRIVYVSCNPSTLARDLKVLSEKCGYKVNWVTPVDMFPQTYHIECIASLNL